MRGPGGGYLLAIDRSEIRIADIILAVDEPIRATRCTPGAPIGCRGNRTRCLTHDLWEELGNQIHLYLSSVSLGRCMRAPGAGHQRPGSARKLTVRRARNTMSKVPVDDGSETYLDWNATAPLRPEAAAAIAAALARCGNPSSVHRRGRAARQAVEAARERRRRAGRRSADSIVFASGGTEANHLALLGAGRQRVLVSAVEHGSVSRAVPTAERIPVDRDGIVELDALEDLLAGDTRPALVSVMLANNETGIVQPAAEIARLAHARRRSLSLRCGAGGRQDAARHDRGRRRSADLVGAQARRPAGGRRAGREGWARLTPMLRGGGQERGHRAGTENIPGIAGFARRCRRSRDRAYERVRSLRDAFEARSWHGARGGGGRRWAPRLPNTSAIAMPGISAETQIIALDLDGVMVSAGAACSSGKVGPSHVLAAMGLPPDIASSTIRVSLGWSSTAAEVDAFH